MTTIYEKSKIIGDDTCVFVFTKVVFKHHPNYGGYLKLLAPPLSRVLLTARGFGVY